MTIQVTPQKTAYHMVNFLHEVHKNMQEVSRLTDVPVNLLWTARKKRDYIFRTPFYSNQIKNVYMKQRDFKEFPRYIESQLGALRQAYELANASGQNADISQLKTLFDGIWPILDQKRTGDFSNVADEASLHYLAGSMLLVAELKNLNGEYLPNDKIERVVSHFTIASQCLTNNALRHRALLSLVSAKQYKAGLEDKRYKSLGEILDRHQIKQLQSVQEQETNNSVTDALNGLKLASILEMEQAMFKAEKDLIDQDFRFKDPLFEGWSSIKPVTDDPDLHFYRVFKKH